MTWNEYRIDKYGGREVRVDSEGVLSSVEKNTPRCSVCFRKCDITHVCGRKYCSVYEMELFNNCKCQEG